jgi:hypothetical protein
MQPPQPEAGQKQPPLLTLDQARELQLAYLEQWRTDLGPVYEDKRVSHRGSIEFALSVLRSLFLLNGGALVTLPVFARFVGVRGSAAAAHLLWPASCFIAGLICCCSAGLIAYLTLRSDVKAIARNIERRAIGVKISNVKIDPAEGAKLQAIEQKQMDRHNKTALRLSIVGAGLAALSLLLFAAGAWLGGFELLLAPKKQPSIGSTLRWRWTGEADRRPLSWPRWPPRSTP